jgi:hypothetical protein
LNRLITRRSRVQIPPPPLITLKTFLPLERVFLARQALTGYTPHNLNIQNIVEDLAVKIWIIRINIVLIIFGFSLTRIWWGY